TMADETAESTATTTTTTETTEAKTESQATTATTSEASTETKQQVDSALNWDQSNDSQPPQDHSDLGDKTQGDWNEQDAKMQDIAANWDKQNADAKERAAADYKWEAEHATDKDTQDWYASRAADAKGDAADFRESAAEHKAERADLQAE